VRTIFISLDTVCADRLSCLGGKRLATPNIDQFARSAAAFTEAFASDIPTQPSHTAMFTGRFGLNSGIVSHFHPPASLGADTGWLPSLFESLGYRTGAVDHLFAMKEWFIRGYRDYMVPPGRSRAPGEIVNGLAFDWLEQHSGEDFFLFLHYWDAHIPYLPPEPYKSAFTEHLLRVDPLIEEKLRSRPSYPLFRRNLYDHLDQLVSLEYIEALHYAEVAYLDDELGRLFTRLSDLGILDDSMIVLFGDHGENMTEHDAWFDHAGLYDSVVHVPLLIRAPGVVPSGEHDALVQLVDVLPTVLDYQGLDPTPGLEDLDGRSLRPVIDGHTTEHRHEVFLSEATWQAKRGLRTRDWKYIRCWDPGVYPDRDGPELYDLTVDPAEQVNLVAARPDMASVLDQRLTEWMDAHLAGREDPMQEVVDLGMPAVARLDGVIREERAGETIDLRSPERIAEPRRAVPA
jgi:arylsulfatase